MKKQTLIKNVNHKKVKEKKICKNIDKVQNKVQNKIYIFYIFWCEKFNAQNS